MNKKNKVILFIVFFIIIGSILVIFFNSNNINQQSDEYIANRTSSTENNNYIESNPSNIENNSDTNVPVPVQPLPQIKEEELTTFSTKIYSTDSARQNNIQITCNTLNDTTVKNGEIFSFCNTVGQSSTSKGYQKADIFDNNGNKKKGLGGGNCQVSTTLYNAVLNVPRTSCNRAT